MRFLFCTFIFCLAAFLNRIELSTSSDFVNAVIPDNLPDISYYANREGELTPLIAGTGPGAVADPPLLLGVKIDGQIHPIYDRRHRWIMVDLHTGQIIPVSINLHRLYRRFFRVHILQRLRINNDGEFYMPRDGHPNGQHTEPRDRRPNEQAEPRNVRRRHN